MKPVAAMDKTEMIQAIVDDLDRWLKDDYAGALEHFKDLEQQRLKKMTDKDLENLYNEII